MCDQKVLIIDSDMEHCRAIKYALLEYGIGAYYALSVVDGIERLMSGSYELVIWEAGMELPAASDTVEEMFVAN